MHADGTAQRESGIIEIRFVRRLTMNILSFAGILLTSLLLQSAPDPEQAVRSWYRSFDGYAGVRAQYQGYVGDTSFDRTYAQLSPSLKSRISATDFKADYAE